MLSEQNAPAKSRSEQIKLKPYGDSELKDELQNTIISPYLMAIKRSNIDDRKAIKKKFTMKHNPEK